MKKEKLSIRDSLFSTLDKNKKIQGAESEDFQKSVKLLTEVAVAIDEFLKIDLKDGAVVTVNVEAGELASAGLRYNVVIRSSSHNFSYYLIRSYISLDGMSITLDSYNEDDAVIKAETFEKVLSKMVSNQWFINYLIAAREILRGPRSVKN